MRHIGVVLCLLAFIQVLPAKPSELTDSGASFTRAYLGQDITSLFSIQTRLTW